jgi:hypothetical protein
MRELNIRFRRIEDMKMTDEKFDASKGSLACHPKEERTEKQMGECKHGTANARAGLPVSLQRASAPSMAELMGFAPEPARNAFKPRNESENLVMRAFVNLAEQVIDQQVRWKPGQDGRWEVIDVHGTPVIEFKDFPEDTVLRMRSANGQVAEMGLKAAGYAFSEAAMNWTMWKLHDAGREDLSVIADQWWRGIRGRIHNTCDLVKDEQRLICWYND